MAKVANDAECVTGASLRDERIKRCTVRNVAEAKAATFARSDIETRRRSLRFAR